MAVVGALCALASMGASSAGGVSTQSCSPVVNPYPGTRYEGINLRHIRATGVSCRIARHVARRAHDKALEITPPLSGVRHFHWHGWRVRGDITGPTDVYVAKRDAKRVTWRF